MTSLRLLTHLGRSTGCFTFKQLAKQQQQRNLCAVTLQITGRTNYENEPKTPSLSLLRAQQFSVPVCLQVQRHISSKISPDRAGKTDTKSSAAITDDDIFAESSKLGLFAKFKLMYKKYWYVLIPVHIVTSVGWFAGFYYLSQSGVDLPSLLNQLHVSEHLIEKIKNSTMGHLAIAYLCYKIATPLRYAVTLGGTTLSIKYLVQAGHIKPLPSKQQLMDMYEQKKADRIAAKTKADK